MFRAMSNPQHVAVSAGPVCVQKELGYASRPALPSPDLGECQLKSQSSQRSALVFKLNEQYSLKLYSVSPLRLHRVE